MLEQPMSRLLFYIEKNT